MTLLARDVMVTEFDTIHAFAPAGQAVEMILNGKVRNTGHKTVSLIVVDELNQLVGVITMFDILYHLRPSYLNYGISGEFLPWDGQMKTILKALGYKKVQDIMSTNVIGASPDEHLMVILDRMVKHKYRRLPIIDDGKICGIVYISDIYHYLFENNTLDYRLKAG